jgi:hypothetical protein
LCVAAIKLTRMVPESYGWRVVNGILFLITPVSSLAYNLRMANLTLVYGLRLLPAEELGEVGDATLKLKNGNEAHVTMHVLEGSKNDIEKQLKTSLEAFFDFYPEI